MVVIDTNIVYSGLRSNKGASFALLEALSDDKFQYAISTALAFEYEDVLMRHIDDLWMTEQQIDAFLDSLIALGKRYSPYFLWRPYLPDPQDDHILELAVASNADTIVTYNLSDFRGSTTFGIAAVQPYQFLSKEKLL